jgi:hypothetical protein
MDILLTTLALLLPVLLGGLWLNLIMPAPQPARTVLVLGNGALIGLLLIPQLLWGLDFVGVPLSFVTTGLLAFTLIILAIVLHLARGKRVPAMPAPDPSAFTSMPIAHQMLFIVLLCLVILRCITLGMEVLWRPLFPWDATMHWATKAKVWFEFRSMVPFVDNEVWVTMVGENVFTDRHPDYPHTVPLLQVWMNLAIGRWDESLMNLPWVLCFIAMGCAFYGQLRVAGASALVAMGFTYMLLSMPLVNIHVALAGYADLFLGATYCAALMAFHNWSTTRCRVQALLATFFAISCMLVKTEGIPWAFTLIPALLLSLGTQYKAVKLTILFSLGALLLLVLASKNPVVIAQFLQTVTEFHPDGLSGTVQAILLHDNLHLLGYVLMAAIAIGLTIPGTFTRTYLGISVALACAVGMFLFLFLFTVFGAGASNFTGVARLCIQLAPGLLFLSAMLCNDILVRARLKRSNP